MTPVSGSRDASKAICLKLGNQNRLAYCYWNWRLVAQEQSDSKTKREKLERALTIFTVQNLLDGTNSNGPGN